MTGKAKLKKLLFWLAILVIACFSIALLNDAASPTAEIAFRKQEKKNLIGPAQIIEILDFENSRYEHLLIGQSEYGYTFFEWSDPNWDKGTLSYQEKTDRVTLFCTQYGYNSMDWEKEWLPIFAFAEHGGAVSARLTLETSQKSGDAVHHFSAERTDGGYFLFAFKMSEMADEEFWLVQQLITGNYSEYELGSSIKATVSLYDRSGNLIETVVFSTANGN